jgi:hypothetical protein
MAGLQQRLADRFGLTVGLVFQAVTLIGCGLMLLGTVRPTAMVLAIAINLVLLGGLILMRRLAAGWLWLTLAMLVASFLYEAKVVRAQPVAWWEWMVLPLHLYGFWSVRHAIAKARLSEMGINTQILVRLGKSPVSVLKSMERQERAV